MTLSRFVPTAALFVALTAPAFAQDIPSACAGTDPTVKMCASLDECTELCPARKQGTRQCGLFGLEGDNPPVCRTWGQARFAGLLPQSCDTLSKLGRWCLFNVNQAGAPCMKDGPQSCSEWTPGTAPAVQLCSYYARSRKVKVGSSTSMKPVPSTSKTFEFPDLFAQCGKAKTLKGGICTPFEGKYCSEPSKAQPGWRVERCNALNRAVKKDPEVCDRFSDMKGRVCTKKMVGTRPTCAPASP